MQASIGTLVRRGVLLLLLAGATLYSLFPMYWMVISGLRSESKLFEPLLTPGPYSIQSYMTIFSLTDFPTYYLNSILVAVGNVRHERVLDKAAKYFTNSKGKVPGQP